MIFKYWVEFDDEGEIKAFYKNKYDCKTECFEYIVKLIPIDRNEELVKFTDELSDKVDQFVKEVEDLKPLHKKFDTEVNKLVNQLKKRKIRF